MRRTIGALLTIAALSLTAACSDGGEQLVAGSGDPTPGGDEPGEGPTTAIVPGGGPDGLVVEVAVGGGFVPVGHDFRTVPSPVVYEDGTTLTAGAMIMVYPGPAVVPVVSGQIGEAEVQALVEAAAEAGLLDEGEPDVGEPPVADAATTTVTVVVDGVEHVTSVYALGMGGGGPDAGDGVDEPMPGITPEQAEQRQRIADFVARVSEVTAVADAEPWEPDRYRVMPLPASAEPPAEEGIEPTTRDWPAPEVTLTEGECSAVTGAAADALRAALADATELTRWQADDSGTHLLTIRPVLPHEPDCPA